MIAANGAAPGVAASTMPPMNIDRETLEALQKNLADSVEKYRVAEQALLDRLIEHRKR